MENMGIDSPSSYTDLRDEAYLYYKYQDNAVEYVENELGVSAYECGKEGVEFPVYECLECGAEQLAHDAKAPKYHCFSCGEDFDENTIVFCSRCGAIMKDNEIDICSCFTTGSRRNTLLRAWTATRFPRKNTSTV